MAIETIASPKTAYQGSVPKVDVPVSGESPGKMPEPLAEKKAAEAPVRGTANGHGPTAADYGSENEYDAKNPAKGAERATGTEALRKAVDEINRHLKHSGVVFGIHDKTNRVTIKIVDQDTKKVLKEYPPEQTLDMIAKVWEAAGLMMDEKG